MRCWRNELIAVYKILGGDAMYQDVYELVFKRNKSSLPDNWKAAIRNTVEVHSSDSQKFKGRDYFQHIGRGHWKLRDEVNSGEYFRKQTDF